MRQQKHGGKSAFLWIYILKRELSCLLFQGCLLSWYVSKLSQQVALRLTGLCRQTSFALGRPDSLGPDEYHTQYLPGTTNLYETDHSLTTPSMLQIVPCMVELSRIMRKVGVRLYTVPCTVQETLARTRLLDDELINWLQSLPPHLQSAELPITRSCLRPKRSSHYIKKQYVVLMIRTNHGFTLP